MTAGRPAPEQGAADGRCDHPVGNADDAVLLNGERVPAPSALGDGPLVTAPTGEIVRPQNYETSTAARQEFTRRPRR